MNERMMVVTLLTLLSIYRLIDFKVKPDTDTIISPFKGKERSFNLKPAFDDLLGIDPLLKLNTPRLIKLESAGPNAVKSAWGASIDALSFIHEPKLFMIYALYNLKCGQSFLTL